MLFGFALLYAATGSLGFGEMAQRLSQHPGATQSALIGSAAVLVFAGIAFKLSLVPFHLWTPDVYQGAPAPVSAFLATVSKGAVFVVMLRWLLDAGLIVNTTLLTGVAVLAALSMLAGNLLALLQQNIKRLLAYSSIAHLGYLSVLVVALAGLADGAFAVEATAYYLTAYTLATLTAFALIGMQRGASDHSEIDTLASLGGLFWRQPLLAVSLAVALLSLAGLPLTAGFIGKFYIFQAAVAAGLWWLIAAMVVGSGIGIFYYLRIIYTMSKPGSPGNDVTYSVGPISGTMVYVILIALILVLGILPQGFIQLLGATF